MTAPRLWLARHADVCLPAGQCYGALDVPAEAQATARAAAALAQALPPGVRARHSPRLRCTQLAHALHALRPDIGLQADARLQEMDFGAWEGQPWSALPRAAIDAWVADFAHHRPGGGESLAQMLTRVQAALQHEAESGAGAQAERLWITHAGVARCVQWLLSKRPGWPSAEAWPRHAPAPGAWITVPCPQGPAGAAAAG